MIQKRLLGTVEIALARSGSVPNTSMRRSWITRDFVARVPSPVARAPPDLLSCR